MNCLSIATPFKISLIPSPFSIIDIMLSKFVMNQKSNLKGVFKSLFIISTCQLETLLACICDYAPSFNINVNCGLYSTMPSGIMQHFLFVQCNMLNDCPAMATLCNV